LSSLSLIALLFALLLYCSLLYCSIALLLFALLLYCSIALLLFTLCAIALKRRQPYMPECPDVDLQRVGLKPGGNAGELAQLGSGKARAGGRRL
jgi:hypothetical protein